MNSGKMKLENRKPKLATILEFRFSNFVPEVMW